MVAGARVELKWPGTGVFRVLGRFLVGGSFFAGMALGAAEYDTTPAPASTNTSTLALEAEADACPDAKRLFALGMIETGNKDREVGGDGEVSRYQIKPSVWKSYSSSTEYGNPEVALQVARRHWNYLAKYFRERAGREADDFDMYVLWNTRFGYYARKGFDARQVSPVIQDRAQRFVNLVNRKG